MDEDIIRDADITVGTVAVIVEGVPIEVDITGDFTNGLW